MTKSVEMLKSLDSMIGECQNLIDESANGASGTVTLAGFTNLEKMVAILNGSAFLGSSTYSGIYLKELTLTSLSTLKAQGGSYSYQVVEFC